MDERGQIDYKKAYEEANSRLQFWDHYREQEKEKREEEKIKADNRLTVIVILALVAVSCFSVGFEYPVDDMNIFSILFNVVINGVGAFLIGGLIYGIGLGIDELIQSKMIKVIAIAVVGFIALAFGSYLYTAQTNRYEDGYVEGERDGYSEGYEDGLDEGYEYGFDEGHTIGYNEGYDDAQ